MTTNYQSHMRRRAATVFAATVAVIFSSADVADLRRSGSSDSCSPRYRGAASDDRKLRTSNGPQAHPECEYGADRHPVIYAEHRYSHARS